MEQYIMAFESGNHYIATEITESDIQCVEDGILSIIRTSDGKMLVNELEWIELPKW